MFERFTERARQVVVKAQDEARKLDHNYIGTEHLLLGLLVEGDGLAFRTLSDFGLTIQDARRSVREIVGRGDPDTYHERIPFTPRSKSVIERSLVEAMSLGQNYVGTEHLLLAMAREDAGVAARIFLDYELPPDQVREAVINAMRAQREPRAAQDEDPRSQPRHYVTPLTLEAAEHALARREVNPVSERLPAIPMIDWERLDVTDMKLLISLMRKASPDAPA